MREKIRISLGVSNLSSSHDYVRRAGIQNVVFNILREILRFESSRFDLVPIFRLPLTNFAHTPFFRPTHFNASDLVLQETLRELGVSAQDLIGRWPYLASLFATPFKKKAYEKACLQAIADTDVFFEISLSDIRNVVDGARRLNPSLKSGVCVHDLCALRYPEYVDIGMDDWFRTNYMECLRTLDFSVSVSRHTALDLAAYQRVYGPGYDKTYYSPLPSPLARRKANDREPLIARFPVLSGKNYLCSVATLEPRKNLIYLIRGFLRFLELFPEEKGRTELLLIGAEGWKSHDLTSLLAAHADNIRAMGFVSNEDLDLLFAHALCLVLPSHYEGFGIPIAQARGFGVPVICCANSSLPEASRLEATYVDPLREDELACALKAIIRTRERDVDKEADDGLWRMDGGERAVDSWRDLLDNWCEIIADVPTATACSPMAATRSRVVGVDVALNWCLAGLADGDTPARSARFHYWFCEPNNPDEGLLQLPGPVNSLMLPLLHAPRGRSALLDSRFLVLSSICRPEAIPGLDVALNAGTRLLVIITRQMARYGEYALFLQRIKRWAFHIWFEDAADLAAASDVGELRMSLLPSPAGKGRFEYLEFILGAFSEEEIA